MIKFEDAIIKVLSNTKELEKERVYIEDALGRILAEDIYSPMDIPVFTNSAMDGFAVKYEDIEKATDENPAVLRIVGTEAAGIYENYRVGKQEAVKIFTGSKIPEGADTVVPIEYTKEEAGKVFIYKSFKKGANIRFKGEEIKRGDLLLKKGTEVTPYEIGLLSQINKVHIWTYSRPKVAVLSTGSELLEIGEEDNNGAKIRSSNNYMLKAFIRKAGGIPHHLGIIKDDKKEIIKAMENIHRYDIFITTGGVSKGEKDFIKDIVKDLGIKIIFHGVLIKPAKPILFGVYGKGSLFFGLPGNPVSSAIAFDLLVYPSIRKMMGALEIFPEKLKAKLIKNFNRKSAERKEFVRAKVWFQEKEFLCEPLEKQGSHMLTSLTNANAYMIVDIGIKDIEEGSYVEIIRFK